MKIGLLTLIKYTLIIALTIFALIWLVCWLMCLGDRAKTVKVYPRSDVLRVMSYNTDNNGQGGDGIEEGGFQLINNIFLNETVDIPDVLLLQETWNRDNELDQLKSTLETKTGKSWQYNFMLETGRNNGNAVFSCYPIIETGVLEFDVQCGYKGRNAVWADIDFNGKKVRAYSAHLESGKSINELCISARRKQWDILKKHSSGTRAIIGGDLNTNMFIGPFYTWDISGLQDCHACYPGSRKTVYLKWYISLFAGGSCLDYIFVSKDRLVGSNSKIWSKVGWISDHYPISTDVVVL